MKYIASPDLLVILEAEIFSFAHLEQAFGGDFVMMLLQYIVSEGNISDESRFVQFLQKAVSPQRGEEMMSLAKIWLEKGEKRGIAKGEKRGALKVARKLLADGMPPKKVSELTSLPVKVFKTIDNNEEIYASEY